MIGEGMDSGDKAANKAMAVALKYALTQMLLLPYDEVDPDGDTPPPSSKKPLPAPAASVTMPQRKSDQPPAKKPAPQAKPDPKKDKKTWGQVSIEMQSALGNDVFFKIMGDHGFEDATQIQDKQVQAKIYHDLKAAVVQAVEDKLKGNDNAKSE